MIKRITPVILLVVFMPSAPAAGFEMTQVPDFQDGQWEFIEEKEQGLWIGNKFAEWGKSRRYRLKKDRNIAGVEVFAFGGEPFYKNWGRAEAKIPHHALKSVDKKWVAFPLGSTARSKGQYNKKTGEVSWVWFEIRIPSGRTFGLYISNPAHQAPSQPVKQGEKSYLRQKIS